MIENLLPLKIPPGIYANGTKYQAAGRWHEGNLVRFHQGTIQPIGGWIHRATSGAAISGTVHAAISWLLADGTPLMAVGTENGLYIIDNANIAYNITPTVAGGNASPYNWQLSLFGAYLIAVNTLLGDDDLSAVNTFVWTGNTAVIAAAAWTTVLGPSGAYSSFVTPERFLTILRGKDQTGHTARTGVDGVYSERRVYFASQETISDFTSTDTNTGGDFDLTTDGRLIVGAASRGQSLLWSDVDLWTMNFIGGQLVYSFSKAGDHCGILSKRAFVMLDKGAFWMGRGKFFMFDGFVRSIPCDVTDAVFGDFNQSLAHKVWAVANPKFNEVTWFYPAASTASGHADRYVTYNYEENHWTLGKLTRSAGLPARFRFDVIDEPLPQFFDGANMYDHETGHEREAQAYVASGPIQLGDGDRLMRIQGILPDDRNAGDVQLRLYTSMSPDALEALAGPYTLGAYTPLRKTARQCRVKLEETGAVDWRVGEVRLAVIPVERRGPGVTGPVDLVPASLEIIPVDVTLTNAQHFTFTSIVRNAAGQVLDIVPDVWTSDAPASVSIDTTGTVTALVAPSTAHIQAFITSHSLTSNIATVHVASRVPASVTITPTLALEQLGTGTVTAVVRDIFGIILTDVAIDLWESNNTAVATVALATFSTATGTGVINSGTCNFHAHITTGVVTPIVSNACVVTVLTHWAIHTFTIGTFDFNVSAGAGNVEALIVAGGGGGAGTDGSGVGVGGGGGGGVLRIASSPVAVGSHVVAVGGGGTQGHYDHFTMLGVDGGNGGNSSFNGNTAIGGGGGALFGATSVRDGHSGGSGGGGADDTITHGPGGAGTAGQGTSGGAGSGSGGGGGGAGFSATGANGGNGINWDTSNITGTPVTYGGGGGGGSAALAPTAGGSGGTGGGGSAPGGAGVNGAVNKGGGGGAGNGFTAGGGFGGDGVVIIKYRTNTGIVATGGTKVLLP